MINTGAHSSKIFLAIEWVFGKQILIIPIYKAIRSILNLKLQEYENAKKDEFPMMFKFIIQE